MDILSLFNQQVLLCQDDAYTLAWYLLGEEAEAEAVMQEAVEITFHCFSSGHEDCRLTILKQVVKQCQGRKPAACGLDEPGIFHDLYFLAEQERVVLVLIDVLGLGYSETGCVTDSSVKEVRRRLAQARWKMNDHRSSPNKEKD